MPPVIVANDELLVDILMPACENAVWSEETSSSSASEPVAYSKPNVSFWPAVIPGPQSVEPEPGRVQVSVPLATTCQPCCVSMLVASFGLYGYGFCVSCGDTKLLDGFCGTGP